MKKKKINLLLYSFIRYFIISLIILSMPIRVMAIPNVYLNDTFDRADSSDIGTNWSGYKTEYSIFNNNLTRTDTETNAGILVNTTLMPLNSSGYVVEIESSTKFPYVLVYFQNMSGKGYGYKIQPNDDDNRKMYLWKVTGSTETLINHYFIETGSWSAAKKITVVAVTNQAKFLVFKDGIYDGYLEDSSNTYTNGYCGIGQKQNGYVEAESFKCYDYINYFFDNSDERGYIVGGEYNLIDGQVYNNLTILRTGILNITDATIRINTGNGNDTAIRSFGGKLKMENSTILPSDENNWSNIILTSTTGTNLGLFQTFEINNSLINGMGKLRNNTDSAITADFSESGSYINNTIFNRTGQAIEIRYSTRSVTINNITIQNSDTVYGVAIKSAQEGNLTISNNRIIGDYKGKNLAFGIYAGYAINWNVYNNTFSGIWHYGIDLIGGAVNNFTFSNNILYDMQKGIVMQTPVSNSVFRDNVIKVGPDGATNSAFGGTITGNNNSFINNTVTSDYGAIGDAGFRYYVGNNVNITGFTNTNISNSIGQLTGSHAYGVFVIENGNNGVIDDIYINPMVPRTYSGILFENITGNNNKNLTISNVTLLNLGYGIHLYSCENCTFRDLNVKGSINDIKIESGVNNITLMNNKNTNFGFAYALSKIENYQYSDIFVQDQNRLPLNNVDINFTNLININFPSINRNKSPKSTFSTEVDGHTALPIGNDSETSVLMSYWQTSTTRQNMSYLISVFDPSYIYTSTPTLVFPNGTLQQLSPLATATVSPDESWYRPNPNTYQNTTVIQVNRTRTNISLKFPNGTMTVTNATRTSFEASTNSTQSYVLINNTLPEFANKNILFLVDGVRYASTMANSTGFMSINYTGSWSSPHTFEWFSSAGSFLYQDVNQDGLVNIDDLNYISLIINTNGTCALCDVNRDGSVDIYDITLVTNDVHSSFT